MDTIDGLVAVLLIIGVIIRLIASIGMVRFGDVYMRMHASTTASTLGLLFILAGTMLHFGDSLITIKLIALGAIYFFTAPIGTQVLAHAAHVSGSPKVKETWIDQMADAKETE